MKDLVIADIIRIFRKPTYRIVLLVCLVLSLVRGISCRMDVWNGYTFVTGQAGTMKIVGLILGISIYLSVYADEFSSNSMQCLIGHGVSRFRLLLAKFLDCVIVSVTTFIIYFFFMMMLGLALGAGTLLSFLNYIPVIRYYHLDQYIFEGMLVSANSAVQLGQASGWLWLLFAIARICVFSIILSFLLFRKKELDF